VFFFLSFPGSPDPIGQTGSLVEPARKPMPQAFPPLTCLSPSHPPKSLAKHRPVAKNPFPFFSGFFFIFSRWCLFHPQPFRRTPFTPSSFVGVAPPFPLGRLNASHWPTTSGLILGGVGVICVFASPLVKQGMSSFPFTSVVYYFFLLVHSYICPLIRLFGLTFAVIRFHANGVWPFSSTDFPFSFFFFFQGLRTVSPLLFRFLFSLV